MEVMSVKQESTKEAKTRDNPKKWKAKGLKWVLGLFAISSVLIVLVLMFYWSREPVQFDVIKNAKEMTGILERKAMPKGAVTTATLSRLASTLLDKPGGFLDNDRTPPGVISDNMPSWEYGVLTHVRDLALIMRDDLSRSQSQSTENVHLVKAQIRFNTDSEIWLLPPAETQYKEGIIEINRYLKQLTAGEGKFYTRGDNLTFLLSKMQKRLGSLSQNLSASVGKVEIDEEYTEKKREEGAEIHGRRVIKTSWYHIDDIFFEARGQAWAMLHTLKAVDVDFREVLLQKNALVSLRQVIRELEATIDPIWSPVIMNGHGYGIVTNHSLVMSSHIARASAALVDMENLLKDG